MQTEIVKIKNPDSPDENQLLFAAKTIRDGGLVVFPTETVYGLGADATNEVAVSHIYEAKGRPSDNPLIIHISIPEDAEEYAYTSDLYYRIADAFMPGPITVVLKSKQTVPKKTRGGLDTVAVRCPKSEIARELIRLSGTAIAAPSANLSGSPSPTVASHVIDDMTGRVDVIIDGGACDIGLESTIVKIEDEKNLTLLRPGKITLEELREIADVKLADAVTDKLRDGEKAISPGMKYKHYAPKAPLVLIDAPTEIDFVKYFSQNNKQKIAIIAYDEIIDELRLAVPKAAIYAFGSINDEISQAHRLFSILRDTDKKKFSLIYAPLPKTSGISLALYNRMIRAAAHNIIRL